MEFKPRENGFRPLHSAENYDPVGADMFSTYGKDPRIDTDADVTNEMVRGYDTDLALSEHVFYESIVAISRFEQNPIELGRSKRFANRRVPRLATGQVGEKFWIVSKEPFGTEITIVNDIGRIRP
ncbi:hypothetical protein NKJ09_31840 [Mesorhizobium sp. M0189]|uniref:hypothetical protein n=1 Tax=Mesorhizobium sp. M0189 TaxID=2956909 RepID=UPI003336F948